MSAREDELALRRKALQARCAVQRHHLAATNAEIETQLGGLDRGINVVRVVVRNPLMVTGAISLIVLLGPRRLLGWLGRGLVLFSTTRRLVRLTRQK